jgi:hypothetical protein
MVLPQESPSQPGGRAFRRRRLRHAKSSYVTLARNPQHQFAMQHALRIFHSRSVYSFIPKNACSTMRLSLAMENGCIPDADHIGWIHDNNTTFSADLESLLTAEYTFVILRSPFTRLASTYLDKITGRWPDMWNLLSIKGYAIDPDDLTFRKFVEMICRPGFLRANIHWRPQVDFLVYEEYDDYIRYEDFALAKERIERKADIRIVDARDKTRHGTDRYRLVHDQSFCDTKPYEIGSMRREGISPSHESLYDDAIRAVVAKSYAEDLKLYEALFS